ncbi:hypothetical protein SB6421_03821 [Klebsiella huaxiensis]|uniref:tail fiber domain-containing protein n=1 Tax=Klebsiella huaxiensis TaxID=2153354 RepID=UPI00115C2066|nr:tail fiber domain-containing protein [Klebsiella huaxiensis]VUS83994.1 hypothetical protein SB6421_03821 [Klebsiella huaxiensis]
MNFNRRKVLKWLIPTSLFGFIARADGNLIKKNVEPNQGGNKIQPSLLELINIINNKNNEHWRDADGKYRLTWHGLESAVVKNSINNNNEVYNSLVHLGYRFMGDYSNGPFQFKKINDYIYYNNHFWRLNQKTDLGFTTSGVDNLTWDYDSKFLSIISDIDVIRDELASRKSPYGASLVSLAQGGNIQQAIHYITLEMLGGGINKSDNAEAWNSWVKLANAGVVTVLQLGSGVYSFTSTPSPITVAHTIKGVGGVWDVNNDRLKSSSTIFDNRSEYADDFLIKLVDSIYSKNNNDGLVHGVNWQDFEVRGIKSRSNLGVYWNIEGFTVFLSNVIIYNFGKTAFGCDHSNDATLIGLTIFDSGGYVNGKVYYAVDFYNDNYQDAQHLGKPNLMVFYRIHIETCRYSLRVGGMNLRFIGGHIEVTNKIDPKVYNYQYENSPTINIAPLTRMVTFSDIDFTFSPWFHYIYHANDAIDNDLLHIIQSIPAGISSTYSSSQIKISNPMVSKVIIEGCTFWSPGLTKYIDLYQQNISVVIQDCHFDSACSFGGFAPIRIGESSRFNNNTVLGKGILKDKSQYADLINDKLDAFVELRGNGFNATNNEIYVDSRRFKSKAYGFSLESESFLGSVFNNQCQGVYSIIKNIKNDQISCSDLKMYDRHSTSYYSKVGRSGYFIKDESEEKNKRSAEYLIDGINLSVNTESVNIKYDGRIFGISCNGTASINFYNNGLNTYFFPSKNMNNYLGSTLNPWSKVYSNDYRCRDSFMLMADKKNLKNINSIDDNILDAWGKVEFQSWTHKVDELEVNSFDAKKHFGILAEQIINAFDQADLDWREYGILNFEKSESTPEMNNKPDSFESQIQGNYMISINECMFLEFALQRREIEKIKKVLGGNFNSNGS